MSESIFPQLLETGSNRSYPLEPLRDLTIGGTPAADNAQSVQPGGDAVFQVGCRDGRWLLKPLSDGTPVTVNQSVVTRTTPLEHLAVIQAAGRVFLFLARDDSDTVTGVCGKAG